MSLQASFTVLQVRFCEEIKDDRFKKKTMSDWLCVVLPPMQCWTGDVNYKLACFYVFQCNSPAIIGFYGAFFIENRISICTEFMDGRCCVFVTPFQRKGDT